jgi:hypothetical protein
MRERPIIFTPENAQKVFAGTKTQTRRSMKPQPIGKGDYWDLYNKGPEWAFWLNDNRMSEARTWKCPHGVVGDRLWIREAHGFVWPDDCDDGQIYDDGSEYGRPIKPQECIVEYKALSDGDDRPGGWPKGEGSNKWKPSIHMPRWACRTVVELTEVRVERVQDITAEDCLAEGVDCNCLDGGFDDGVAFGNFLSLWESTNGKGSWLENPFVWVLVFKKVKP